jgi:hypothetical protein
LALSALAALTTLLAALSGLLLLLTRLLLAAALLAALTTLLTTLILLARLLFVGVHICSFNFLPGVTTSALKRSSSQPSPRRQTHSVKLGSILSLPHDPDIRSGSLAVSEPARGIRDCHASGKEKAPPKRGN